MELSQINEWLSLVANIGVLLGIAFLIVEIKQNTEAHRSDSRKALMANDQASLLVALDHTDIFTKMGQIEKLTQEDQYRLSFVYAIDLRNREFEYFQYKSGSLDEDSWKSYRNLILANHANERGRVWWNKVGRGLINPNFAKMVDEMLSNTPNDEMYDLLGSWDEGL